jgi:hypothetical protein
VLHIYAAIPVTNKRGDRVSFPKCPHCKYEFSDEDIWHSGSTIFPMIDDGAESDTKCSNCNEPLKIVLNLRPSWSFVDEFYDEIV